MPSLPVAQFQNAVTSAMAYPDYRVALLCDRKLGNALITRAVIELKERQYSPFELKYYPAEVNRFQAVALGNGSIIWHSEQGVLALRGQRDLRRAFLQMPADASHLVRLMEAVTPTLARDGKILFIEMSHLRFNLSDRIPQQAVRQRA